MGTDTAKLADEIECLAKDATKRGPWKVTNAGLGIEATPDASSDYDPIVIGGCKGGKGMIGFPSYGIYSQPGRREGEANAALIVALVNNAPTIIAALRELEALRAREVELREALKPFAKAADLRDAADENEPQERHYLPYKLTHADLRRARAALGGKG